MTRTIGVGLTTHLTGDSQTRCNMLRIDCLDGTEIGFTDHDLDLTFDLGDGSLLYQTGEGILPSNVVLSTGFSADNFEVRGPLGDVVSRESIMGGRLDMARARLFQVNWQNLAHGAIPLLKGYVAERRVEGGEFVFQVRSEIARLNQIIGRKLSPYCPGDHDECCINIAPETMTTVTAVTNKLQFDIAATIDAADHIQGRVEFTTGPLAGTKPVEIFAVSGNTITVYAELKGLPEIGDNVTVKEGADLTRATCRDRFANGVWFRGFADMPGTDQILRYPVPKSS